MGLHSSGWLSMISSDARCRVQDITVGNPAKAQLARAVRSAEEAFNVMKGNFFVVETKFDGGYSSMTGA